METYYLFVFFIFGLVFGSFFNVVGYRLPLKMSLIKPASHCPQCDHKLTALELIPVFSYLFQGGKCKNCGKKIPIFYQYQYFKPIGGDERVRTSAPLSGPNCLANSPLHHLGTSPNL